MKAAVLFKANTPLEIVELAQEGPRAGEARVKVKAAGICHSDWHIMNGDWTPPLPMVLGHEAAGIVEEVGAGVTNVVPGDHIIFSFRPHCGRCLYCSIGRSILCDGYTSPRWGMLDGTYRLKNKGQDIYQMARIGTFSERVVCPAEMLVPIRKEMPWPQAALMGCCVPTGVGAVTPPQPMTRTEAPASTSAQRVTAPTPVGTQQPISAAWGHGISLRMGPSISAGHTTFSAKVPIRASWLSPSPLRDRRGVPSNITQRGVSLWPSQRIERPSEQ